MLSAPPPRRGKETEIEKELSFALWCFYSHPPSGCPPLRQRHLPVIWRISEAGRTLSLEAHVSVHRNLSVLSPLCLDSVGPSLKRQNKEIPFPSLTPRQRERERGRAAREGNWKPPDGLPDLGGPLNKRLPLAGPLTCCRVSTLCRVGLAATTIPCCHVVHGQAHRAIQTFLPQPSLSLFLYTPLFFDSKAETTSLRLHRASGSAVAKHNNDTADPANGFRALGNAYLLRKTDFPLGVRGPLAST